MATQKGKPGARKIGGALFSVPKHDDFSKKGNRFRWAHYLVLQSIMLF